MRDSNTPTKIPKIWASSASAPYIGVIPTPSQIGITNGAASWTDGFPPLCFVPYSSGGAGPWGADFNGALNQMSAGIQWYQAGAPIYYDAPFSSSIGGYPQGAVISQAATLGRWWISTVDNNTSNPDTGGANWNSIASGGSLLGFKKFTASGTYTPSAGANAIVVQAVGAGGAGGGCAVTNSPSNYMMIGTNGTSGAYGEGYFTSGFSAGVTVTIGAGGTGGAGTSGGNGGATSFGALVVCPGGIGGAPTAGGPQAVPVSGGQANLTGLPSGSPGANVYGRQGHFGQPSFVQSAQCGWGGKGGESPFADGGSAANINQNGLAGSLGSGGSGTASFNYGSLLSGGNGGGGFVIVWEFG